MIADKDLRSIQQARILAENAREAQKKLIAFTQEKLDEIVECVASEVEKHVQALAVMSHEETDYGIWQDKWRKNLFICRQVRTQLRGMRCVGIIAEDQQKQIMDIGVPVGVIVALCPVTNPVSTTIYKTLLAIKSGNAIIFSPHPRALKSMRQVLDIIISAAASCGLPDGSISYLNIVAKNGTMELMNHGATSLIMLTGVPGMLQAAQNSGKPLIFGSTGNGPAFIERTANIQQAVRDIIKSKTFDNGIAPSTEQSIIVDACVSQEVMQALRSNGAYFMTDEESHKLAVICFDQNGRCIGAMVGLSAKVLAHRAGFSVPDHTTILIAARKYVSEADPYSKGFIAPVLAYYVEDDWMHACEKCIELLLHERKAHTLVIHSSDKNVILQFALKKPVGRLLVNTPAAFGGIGVTTNLFPAMTLGSGSAGQGITSDNVSPLNLIYMRRVGYGVRQAECIDEEHIYPRNSIHDNDNAKIVLALQQVLREAIEAIDESKNT